MPLYEYKCSKCGTTFEVIQKITDAPIKKCPQCGGRTKKIMSPSALQFKGSGWYITDYAGKNKDTAPQQTKPGKKEETAKSASDADKKPEKQPSPSK